MQKRKGPQFWVLSLSILLLLGSLVAGCKKRVEDDPFSGGARSSSRGGGNKAGAKKAMMYGRVVDRNDQALKGVSIRVAPGATEIFSNKWGEYEIESLRADDGSPMELQRGQDYTINAWKPGYHETTQIFRYEGDVSEVPTITLIEDSIKLEPTETKAVLPDQMNQGSSGGGRPPMENE